MDESMTMKTTRRSDRASISSRAPLALALATLMMLAACGGSEPEPVAGTSSEEPLRTAVLTAAFEAVPTQASATGSVQARRQVAPGSKILGRIDRVAVDEGDRIRSGQLLARLDRRDLDAAVAQAEAGVEVARAALENATAQHARIVALHARGSATDKSLEDATAGLRIAQAGLAQTEANVGAAQVMIDYSEVRSPLDGWVVRRYVQTGDMARPGEPMFVLEDLSRVKIVAQVAEGDVARLRSGMPASVTVEALGERFDTTIDSVVPAADAASRTFDLRLWLDNPEGHLRSGLFARVDIAVGSRQVLRIPDSALVRRGQLQGIWVLDDTGRAHLRWITAASPSDGSVEVLSGLDAGERFLPDPPERIAAGVQVAEG